MGDENKDWDPDSIAKSEDGEGGVAPVRSRCHHSQFLMLTNITPLT